MAEEAHDGHVLVPAAGGHDFADPDRDGVVAKLGAHGYGVFVLMALVLIRTSERHARQVELS